MGKISTVAVTLLANFLPPIFGHYSTIIEGINKLISYVAPPITTVFLVGVFWKRASGQSAFITLIGGAILGATMFGLDWYNIYQGDFMLNAFGLFVVLIMIVTSFLFPEPLREEARPLVWKSWREPLRGEVNGNGLGNYRIAAVFIFIIFITLYIIFR